MWRAPHVAHNEEIRQNFDSLEDFLKLLNIGQVAMGKGTVTFVEPNTSIDKIEVEHGMGVIPLWIGIMFVYADDGHQCLANLSSVTKPTKTKFTFGVRDTSGVANKLTKEYQWIAVA